MRRTPTAAELIAEKYRDDGPQVVHDYRNLDFSKHVRLMQEHMGLQAGSKVLDVGCGTGALLTELARAGAEVTGIDTFGEADGIDRRIAEARMKEQGLEIPLRQGSAAKLPFDDGAFDLVVSIGMLEHIPPETRKRVLPEMFRVVRPGGVLFLIAGPTNATPFDQHIPGHPLVNWMPRGKKLEISMRSGRRQFLDVPWGVSRRELHEALPNGEFRSLYGKYFAAGGGGEAGRFTLRPFGFMVWAKRKFKLNRFFGLAASMLYALRQEHCHILAIRKR